MCPREVPRGFAGSLGGWYESWREWPAPWLFVKELSASHTIPKMDHLICFLPGAIALEVLHEQKRNARKSKVDLRLAHKLVETCVHTYWRTASDLAPEITRFNAFGLVDDLGSMHNILRPETIESLFVLWRTTKKQIYRNWGQRMLCAFHRSKTPFGFASLHNVNHPTKKRDDMPSFFVAETLKYLFLLFSDDAILPLDQFVLGTEAHPVPLLQTLRASWPCELLTLPKAFAEAPRPVKEVPEESESEATESSRPVLEPVPQSATTTATPSSKACDRDRLQQLALQIQELQQELRAEHASCSDTGDPTCWVGGYSFQECCVPPPGNPLCWDAEFTYARFPDLLMALGAQHTALSAGLYCQRSTAPRRDCCLLVCPQKGQWLLQPSPLRPLSAFSVATCAGAVVARRSLKRVKAYNLKTDRLPDSLGETLDTIETVLRNKNPQRHDRIRDHELGPLLPKRWWTHLGVQLKAQEETFGPLPADAWISLRLDGCCWGTVMSRLKSSGILEQGFRNEIAEAMITSCRAVMCEFDGILGYTHSDEMTIIVPPGSRVCDGSVSWWVSTAASVASAACNRSLAKLAAARGLQLPEIVMAHFDCRVGVFDSARQAEGLVLWRAADCNVNSASDAIKFSDAPFAVREYNTIQKLCYLQERSGLPMQRHQAYGSLIGRIALEGRDVLVLLNSGCHSLPKHIHNLARLGTLVPSHSGPKLRGPAKRLQTFRRWWARLQRGLGLVSGPISEQASKFGLLDFVVWPCSTPKCVKDTFLCAQELALGHYKALK
ncbi:MNS3 [Symbiodinium necroappetens]|uniref:alpha-1,2-Mannosidase n=1 Tax=Symbiodinium necroappetens TaxID=1628268 RepID=A0A813AGM3_9DINO|nr:MNS3 [Symbiodinium necroappetens]